MISNQKVSLQSIRAKLSTVESATDPIVRGKKLAELSAEITNAAAGIQAPFKQTNLS